MPTAPLPAPGTRVLISGANGFIGSHLCARLVAIGCEVVAIVRPGSDPWRIESFRDSIELVEVDVGEPAVADSGAGHWIRDAAPEIAYHLAAAGVDPRNADAAAVTHVNTIGTLNMLELAGRSGVGRFVYCGSCFEYGAGADLDESCPPAPNSEYGAAKAAGRLLAEAFSRRHGLPVVSLRPFTVYGPAEAERRLVPYSIRKALAGEDIELTGGEQCRDFVFVADVVDAFLLASTSPGAVGRTLNVCSGEAVSVRAIVETVIELTRSSARPVFGARPYRDTEVASLSGNPSAASEVLGWRAETSLREGLRSTIAAARERTAREHAAGAVV